MLAQRPHNPGSAVVIPAGDLRLADDQTLPDAGVDWVRQ
jgi:hypothetical protein